VDQPLVSVSLPPLSFMEARRFGAERDRLLPSIPNGGID
jgi:hypothetical protein